jgi:hypothetical protein
MLIGIVERRIPIQEVSIATIYESAKEASHFQPAVDSFRIYRLLGQGPFKKLVKGARTLLSASFANF